MSAVVDWLRTRMPLAFFAPLAMLLAWVALLPSRADPLEPLRDPDYFAKVRVDPEAATVVWPNGADKAPETLYAEARENPLIAA